MVLKALGPHQYYDSDDDYLPDRAPLLQNSGHPPSYVVGDPAWSIKINDKVMVFNLLKESHDLYGF